MRIALFVEGSAPVGTRDACERLWNATLLPALGRAPIDLIVPIGKDAISRLRGLRTSTSAPSLDERIKTARDTHGLAIEAMRQLRPRPDVRRQIRETWDNAKDEWGEYLLRKLLEEPKQAVALREHPIARRLSYILPAGVSPPGSGLETPGG